ncbi:MAG: hypothetical protein INR73_13880 [Williamsia sp.]|nr:hypothetical protein [Williamsia sp.]
MKVAQTNTLTTDAVDKTKLQKVINKTGVDIAVGLPVDSSETELSSVVLSSNKDFELLNTASGGTTIKNGASDTVTLNRTYIDPKTKKPTYSMGYDLLISSSAWLTPLANIGVIQDFDDDMNDFFDDVTATSDQATGLSQAATFYQTISAYPDSQLAKDYLAAVNNANTNAGNQANGSSSSASNTNSAINNGVNTFFQNHPSYSKVTLGGLVALENYYNCFPFVWAQYKDSVSYFLYSSDGSTTSFLGTLDIKKSGNIDITKANGGYTCTFNPAVTPTDTSKTDVDTTKAKTLTYSNGIFTEDVNADVPQVALKGSFQLKRTFTKDPTDTTIFPVISGSYYGAVCVGFDAAQATKPDNSTQDWLNSLFHPKGAANIFASVMTILGALMMLHFLGSTLYGIVKWVREKVPSKTPVEKTDLDAQKTTIQDDLKAKIDEIYKKVTANDGQKVPESSDAALDVASTTKSSISDQVSASQMESNLVDMKNNLKDLEQYASEGGDFQGRISEAATSIREDYQGLTQADIADLKGMLSDMRTQIDTLSKQVVQLNKDVQQAVNQEQQADMQENVENMEAVQKAVDDEKKTSEDEEGDGTETDPDADPLPFPDGLPD